MKRPCKQSEKIKTGNKINADSNPLKTVLNLRLIMLLQRQMAEKKGTEKRDILLVSFSNRCSFRFHGYSLLTVTIKSCKVAQGDHSR